MTKLAEDVLKNYISVLLHTIPEMISGASPAGRAAAYCGVAVFYPLALVVLLGLVAVALTAVYGVRPFIPADKSASAR